MSSDIYYTVEDGEVPPSYFEAISPTPTGQTTNQASSSGNGLLLPASVTTSVTSPLTTHLHNLPIRLRANQEARATEQASRDLDIISLLVPHVEKFLDDLGSMSRTPPRAELTLVPGTVVPRGAKMSGASERRREGEVVRVVRVEFPPTKHDSGTSKGASEKGGGPSNNNNNNSGGDNFDDDSDGSNSPRGSESGFDEWGRFDTDETSSASKENPWFFRDEAMANRLATYLRPEPNLDRRHIQAVVENGAAAAILSASSSSSSGGGGSHLGWRWGRKKQQQPQQQKAASPAPVSPNSPLLSPGESEQATMSVHVEEVAFRTVNDFGIYESLSGYGIVVTVKIRR